jgi:hypothetical protein
MEKADVAEDVEDGSREPLMSSTRDTYENFSSHPSVESNHKSWRSWSRHRKILTLCGISVFIVAAIMLPLTFVVIVPAEVNSECERLQLSVDATYVTNPTDEGFESTVFLKFSDNAMLPATAHMESAKMSWYGAGGGHLLNLKHINTIHVSTDIQHMKSYAMIDNVTAFTDFNEYIINANDFKWRMKGEGKIHVLGMNVLTPIDKSLDMHGYNNFLVNPVISNVTTGTGTPTILYATAEATLYSTANIVLNFGQSLHFHIKSNGFTIGIGTIQNCSMLMGSFTVSSDIEMFSESTAEYNELMKVLGNFVSGIDSAVTMENFYLENRVQWLEPALNEMYMESVMPGVSEVMVRHIDMYVKVTDLINVPFTVDLYNAIDTAVTVYGMTCNVVFENEHIATVTEPTLNIYIEPKEMVVSPTMTARVDFKHMQAVLDLLDAGEGLLDLNCQLTSSVEAFSAELNYVQLQTPTTIHQGRF